MKDQKLKTRSNHAEDIPKWIHAYNDGLAVRLSPFNME